MKILFLCSCLEAGSDGVGDYTRKLADSCAELGAETHIIALSDHKTETIIEDNKETTKYVRLPRNLTALKRFSYLRRFASAYSADWISLQFVSYGFQSKGLVYGLGAKLKRALGNAPFQIMFHELWVGAQGTTNLRQRFVGNIQRMLIRRMVNQICPVIAHTHAMPYHYLLGKYGIKTEILPLGSNIQTNRISSRTLPEIFQAIGSGNLPQSQKTRIFTVLGNTPPEWSPAILFKQIWLYGKNESIEPVFVFCGRGAPGGKRRRDILKQAVDHGIKCVFTGFLTEADVAIVLAASHFGVATVPFPLWQKSGAVAAMRSFGLPVIFTRFEGTWPQSWLPPWEADFICCDAGMASSLAKAEKHPMRDFWPVTAHSFMNQLQAASLHFCYNPA